MDSQKHSSEIEHLNAVYEIATSINFMVNLRELLDKIMAKVCKVLNAEGQLFSL